MRRAVARTLRCPKIRHPSPAGWNPEQSDPFSPTTALTVYMQFAYTKSMNGFDWDEENINHLARHNINPQEAEELFNRDPIVRPDTPAKGERRFLAYGMTARGRLLTVSYTERKEQVRPITGWDMTRPERRKYEKEILENLSETGIQE